MNQNTKNIFVYSIITLIYAVFFTPLLVDTSLFFPYITGKAFAFRLIVEIATLLYIVLAVFDRSYLPKKGVILGSIMTFVVVLGLATINAEDPAKSFWSNFERMEGYVTILHLFFFFIVATSVLKTKKAWYALFNTSIGISIVLGLRAFADYDPGRNGPFILQTLKGIKYFFSSIFGTIPETIRIAGSLGNSSYLGVYSLIHAFLAGLMMITLGATKSFKEASTRYVLYIVSILFNVVILYNTGTRGSFVGLVAGLFVSALIPLLYIAFGKSTLTEKTVGVIKKASIGFLVLIALVIGLLGFNKKSSFVQSSDLLNRFSQLITFDVKGVLETHGKARSLLWGMSLEGVKERPLLGWGQDNFPYVFAKHYDPKMYAQEQWFDRTHNVFFDWLIAGGILGLVSYLSLFVALIYVLWRKVTLNKENEIFDVLEKSIITGLLAAYFIHNIFIFDNLASYIFFFILLAYVHQQSTASTSKVSAVANSYLDSAMLRGAVVLAAVLLFGYVSNQAVYKPYMAGKTLIQALQRSHVESIRILGEAESSPKRVYELFSKALAYDTFANTEIRERLVESVPTILARNKDAQVSKDFNSLVMSEYQRAFKENPNDPRPYVFLSMYFQKFGLLKEAAEYMEKALELSPTKQSFLFQKGIIQIASKQFDPAMETFKKAYELEMTSTESKVMYVLSAIYANKFKDVKPVLEGDKTTLNDQRILQTLIENKMQAEISQVAEMQISADPQNPQVYMTLAGLYLKIKQPQEAIKYLRKLIEIMPDFKAEGEFYISEIQAGRDPSSQQ